MRACLPPRSRNQMMAWILGPWCLWQSALRPGSAWPRPGHPVQPLLVRLVEVERHFLHRGRDQEQVGLDASAPAAAGRSPCRSRLRRRSRSPCSSSTTGMPPPPTAMTTNAGVDQLPGSASARRCAWGCGEAHHPPPAAPGILDHGPAISSSPPLFGLGLVHERADGLGRILEGRIVAVDQHLRDDGRRRCLLMPRCWNSLCSACWNM